MNGTPEPKVIPPDIQTMSADELIKTHREIADHLTAQTSAFRDYCKPFTERQDFIENRLLGLLVELNRGKVEGKRANISTDAGTAYLSTIVTPKILDKTAYLDWILDSWDDRGAMLQISAPQKDAWNEYWDQHKQNPPHTESTSFTRVNIRRS